MKSKPFIAASIILTFLLSTVSAQTWKAINSSTQEDLTDVLFINNSEGFCIGKNGTLIKTTDKGENWSAIQSTTNKDITDILYKNDKLYLTAKGGLFLSSSDKGNNWSSVTASNSEDLNCVDFKNTTYGLAGGSNGNIYETNDGGNSWSQLGSFSVFIINDIRFVNDTLVLAVGAGGVILKSGDGGKNFSNISKFPTANLFSISEELNGTVKLVGNNGQIFNYTMSTATVTEETINNSNWLQEVICDNSLCYAVGYSNTFLAYQSTGWEDLSLDSTIQITGIDFLDDTTAIVCGLAGKIFKTVSRGGFSPIGVNKYSIKNLNAYPNPTNSILRLVTQDFATSTYSLDIYSLQGKKVMSSVLSRSQNEIDLSSLAKGAYLLRAISGNSTYQVTVVKK